MIGGTVKSLFKSGVRDIKKKFSDQNEDGTVDVNDLLMLIANWGTCG